MANTAMGPETETVDPDWLIEWSLRYNRGGINSQYLYNFRHDSESEDCCCGDAATWPTLMGQMRYLGNVVKVDIYDDNGKFTGSSYIEIG